MHLTVKRSPQRKETMTNISDVSPDASAFRAIIRGKQR